MSVAIFAKVFTLGIRTLSKPLGHQFQNRAMQHPGFRRQAIGFAQVYNLMEVYISRGAEGKESKAFVAAISDEKAMDLAAKVHGIVIKVGAGIVTWEYFRNAKADAIKKELQEQKELQQREQAIAERKVLQRENEEQTGMIRDLANRLEKLETDFHVFRKERLAVTP